MRKLRNLGILGLVSLGMFSCSSDDDVPVAVNEEEVITTSIVTLTEGTNTITLTALDADGDGQNFVFTEVGDINASTTYQGTIQFWNATETPAENVTTEIQTEDDEHQIFFDSTIGTVSYTDTDENTNPVGLSFELQTGTATTTGSFRIRLQHGLDKNATNVSTGDITNAGGTTEFDVVYSGLTVN